MAKTPLQHAAAEHHVVSTSTSLIVLFALAGLMALTIGASYVHMPTVTMNNTVAMAIACTKAFLVMWFFMGLRHATALTRLWALAGFIVFSLMFIILFDYNMRSNEVVIPWNGRAETSMPRIVDPVKSHEQPVEGDVNLHPRG